MDPSAVSPRSAAELVQLHQAPLRSYLSWLGVEATALDDVMQDAFVALLRSAPDQRSDAATLGWLRTVARNLWLQELRRRGRAVHVGFDDAVAAWERFAGDDEGEAVRAALRVCVGELAERQRRALQLRYVEQRPVAEVGAELGIGATGAESLLVRLRQSLRRCVQRRLG